MVNKKLWWKKKKISTGPEQTPPLGAVGPENSAESQMEQYPI